MAPGGACLAPFREALADFWQASGAPLGEGGASAEGGEEEDCLRERGGALFEVSARGGAGDDGGAAGRSAAGALLDGAFGPGLGRALGGAAGAFRGRAEALLAEGFRLCAPAACSRPSAAMALAALALTAGSGAIPGAGLLQLGRGILDGGGALDAAGALLNVRLLRSPAAASLEATSCGQGLLALPGAGGLAGDGEGEPCMPALAFGTAGLGEGTAEAVAAALEAGFRAFDTATHPAAGEGFGYDQGALGAALSAAWTQRPRQEIFLASKVHPADFGYQGALQAVERAVEELGPAAAGHLDLVLLHWPTCEDEFCPRGGRLRPLGDFLDAWRGLEEARSRGLVRSLGVSNFDAEQLGSLLRDARVKPSVAGLWADIFHPVPRAMRRLCREQGVRLQVFGTLGYEWSQARGRRGWRAPRSSPLLDHPEVRRIARARGLTVSEVCLKFFLQQGIAVVATSRQPARAFAAGDLRSGRRLSGEDLEALRDLEGFLGSSLRPLYSPDHYAGMLGFDTQAMAPPPGAASSAAAWSCEEARARFRGDGVALLRGLLPGAALESGRRAARRLLWENGGGADIEDPESFPEALREESDLNMAWMDTTVRAHLFPILQAVRELASCLLAADEPVMNYVIARAKLPGSAKQHIPWHQDMSYSLMAATRARERSEALPELSAHADRSLVLHVPLTDETTANGALMYAKGSHRDGLHPRFFQEAWRSPDGEPSGSELGGGFADGHEGVETLETRAGDVLAHTLFTHHGSHPNDSPGVRWHLEVGVQDASLTNHWGYHRPPLPAGLSRHELAQWLGDLAAMQQGLCASGAEPTACG